MKYLKALLVAVIILPVLFVFFMIAFGKIMEVNETAVESYGRFNNTTNNILEKYEAILLPDKSLAAEFCRSYIYEYQEPFFGDANFYIYAKLELTDAAFVAELERLGALCGTGTTDDGVYVVQGSKEEFENYSDDEILDGMFYVIEIAKADKDTGTIEYLTAYLWDYHPEELVLSFVNI